MSSCTYVSYTDTELQEVLSDFAMRAIARFKFPQVPLAYEYDEEKADYFFTEEVTMREIDVIAAWMKTFWVEYQLSKERNYENLYADKDVKAFSSGNLISSIEKSYSSVITIARKVEENYYRVGKNGEPTIGDINV